MIFHSAMNRLRDWCLDEPLSRTRSDDVKPGPYSTNPARRSVRSLPRSLKMIWRQSMLSQCRNLTRCEWSLCAPEQYLRPILRPGLDYGAYLCRFRSEGPIFNCPQNANRTSTGSVAQWFGAALCSNKVRGRVSSGCRHNNEKVGIFG